MKGPCEAPRTRSIRTMLLTTSVPTLLALALLPAPAQETAPHAHGDPRPTHDAARFITSRTSGVELPLPDEEDAFFFVVYGDRTGGPAEGIQVLAQAVEETNLLGPDLVMTVGDLIQGYNTEAPWMEQMREFRDTMAPLRMPWFPVAGNHDVYYRAGEGGPPRPAEEHEGRYEMHFGPLWYAFRHKSAWFIVLYTDEPNPETGERNFNKPECQRMSPEQFAWLDETLKVTQDADHVFVFCHHPRWIGGHYGDDWDRVHRRLVEAGNVSAVFGGHIHRMRYDPKDGIEYFALATVGGHQEGSVPEAGFLHCFDLVTVRKERIERATLPVGVTMDPREITGEVCVEAPKLCSVEPHWRGAVALGTDGAVEQRLGFSVTNPTAAQVDLEVRFASDDPRWSFVPDHVHGRLDPSGTLRAEVLVTRAAGTLDGGLQLPTAELGFDYLTESARFAVPRRTLSIPFDLSALPLPPVPTGESVVELSGSDDDYVVVPADALALPDGPFTLEAWVRPDRLKGRQGLVCKTEGSEYGLFASDGVLTFPVHLDGKYVEPEAHEVRLRPGAWQHVAGVFDGEELRLYLDGRLVAREEGNGNRTTNGLPLVVGGDVNRQGLGTSTLDGRIDEVRLSRGAVYTGETFEPRRRLAATGDTVLLLHMDAALGPFLRGEATCGAELRGGARIKGTRSE